MIDVLYVCVLGDLCIIKVCVRYDVNLWLSFRWLGTPRRCGIGPFRDESTVWYQMHVLIAVPGTALRTQATKPRGSVLQSSASTTEQSLVKQEIQCGPLCSLLGQCEEITSEGQLGPNFAKFRHAKMCRDSSHGGTL